MTSLVNGDGCPSLTGLNARIHRKGTGNSAGSTVSLQKAATSSGSSGVANAKPVTCKVDLLC
jgi:hypothetical protein